MGSSVDSLYHYCLKHDRQALLEEWDYEKNSRLNPETVSYGSHRKVWWRCKKGHEWEAVLQSRTLGDTGCPVCAGKVVIPGENDLASHSPELAEQWDYEANGTLKPHQVTPYSNRRVWWRCKKGHAYQAIIADRTKGGRACPYCSGRRVLEGFNDLETLQPAIAAQWCSKMNGELTPRMVTAGSNKKVWWQCPFGHVWKAPVYARTAQGHWWCPVCAGKAKASSIPPIKKAIPKE